MKRTGLLLALIFCLFPVFADGYRGIEWWSSKGSVAAKLLEKRDVKEVRDLNDTEKRLASKEYRDKYLIAVEKVNKQETKVLYYFKDGNKLKNVVYIQKIDNIKEIRKSLGKTKYIYKKEGTVKQALLCDQILNSKKVVTPDYLENVVLMMAGEIAIEIDLTEVYDTNNTDGWDFAKEDEKRDTNYTYRSVYFTDDATIVLLENLIEGYAVVIYTDN